MTLPNVRAAFVAFLRADTEVRALCRNIGLEVVPPWPCVRVSRNGGPGDPFYLDRCLVQVDVYGEPGVTSEAQTDKLSDIDRAIAGAIEARLRNHTHGVVRFAGYTALTLGQQDRDPQTRQERVWSRYLLSAHGLAQ